MSDNRRRRLYAELAETMRESSARTVMLHQTIADRFGLNSTDVKCLDLARDEDHLTAGRLAELTAMSTSAVTAVLDRLERRGLVERQRDPADRRKVIVVATGAHLAAGKDIFDRLGNEVDAVLEDYSEDELTAFVRIMTRFNELARDFTATLAAENGRDSGQRIAPARRADPVQN